MKFKVVCFLLCACFCLCSVSLSSSAVDDEPYYPLPEDLIDMGFVMDSDGSYIYDGLNDPFDNGFSFFFTNRKNYPDFSPSVLPWGSMPDYVQNIISMRLPSYLPSTTNLSIPLVLLRVRPTLIEVYVGINVFLGKLNNSSGSFNLFTADYHSALYNNSVCYWAVYDHSGKLTQDWSKCSKTAFGDKNSIYQLQSYFFGNLEGGELDYYLWGGNALREDIVVTSISLPYSSSDSNLQIQVFQDIAGFSSGRFMPLQDQYSFQYFSYFNPPTKDDLMHQLQEEQNETSKGIWETLKSIPDMIGEKIKGLFVPSDGFFNTYTSEFQEYFKERFGLLYEIPELFINLLTKIMTFNPSDDEYVITFPEVVLPVLEDGEWRDHILIEAQEYSFDIINEAPFSLLYDMYIAFLWLVYILLLVNLIRNKANNVFKGG